MREQIKEAITRIENTTQKIRVISHHDTDGITSAAIMSRTLQRWNKKFTLQIVKGLDPDFIEKLPADELLVFLDLASGSLKYLGQKPNQVIILDHHEIIDAIPSNVLMVNPLQSHEEPCSGAAVCYLFARELNEQNRDLASLAIVGMVGDMLDTNLTRVYEGILRDAGVQVKKGLLLYPSTRPVDKVLEYSTSIYIPGVTGSFKGVIELLREANIPRTPQGYKSLAELTDEEMGKLTTAIVLKRLGAHEESQLIGNIYLLKFFNNSEDARELSALINACSRMGSPETALMFCLGNRDAKKEAERIYMTYKQSISAALRYIEEADKITGNNFTIINAQDKIKDTIIGTAASIISFSSAYPQGTIIIAMAYDGDKIKVSARLAGRKGRNVRDILTKVVLPLSGEVGGHPNAAGALLSREKEQTFIEEMKKALELDVIKV